jgi:hypothetical protein
MLIYKVLCTLLTKYKTKVSIKNMGNKTRTYMN